MKSGSLMSEDNQADLTSCCASCGTAEFDDIKLKDCDGCDLVKYCSDECREDHKSEHKEEYKKRAAKLRDELLFKRPESSHLGDCPICCLPLALDPEKSFMKSCCSKIICIGCVSANMIRQDEMRLQHTCPFCREAFHETEEEGYTRLMKRIEANDPDAMVQAGKLQYHEGHYRRAFDYFTKAAKSGSVDAHYRLAILYHDGEGVEKDRRKENYHLVEAAIGGDPDARYNLGVHEWNYNFMERAVTHWIIAAAQGHDDSIKALMKAFKKGHVSKEELDATLRAHHAAVNATKSPQRLAAERACAEAGMV